MADGGIEVGGVAFETISKDMSDKSNQIRKTPWMVERYRQLAAQMPDANIVEVGMDSGGSTRFLNLLFKPKAFLGVDISPEVPDMAEFIAEHGADDSIRLHWEVDQADLGTIGRVCDELFGDAPLDLVIDDASHLLGPTEATFSLLFPRLRPGGVYVIEDWSWQHRWARGIEERVAADPDGKLATAVARRVLESEEQPEQPEQPLSRLLLELLIVSGRSPELVVEVVARSGWAEVTRGPEQIKGLLDLSSCLGRPAREVLTVREST